MVPGTNQYQRTTSNNSESSESMSSTSDSEEHSYYRTAPPPSNDKSEVVDKQAQVEHANKQLELVKVLRRKLLLVPLVFILLRIPESIFRIREYVIYYSDGGQPQDQIDTWFTIFLNVLQAIFNPAQGFFNFILFILASPKSKKTFMTFWKRRSDVPLEQGSEEEMLAPPNPHPFCSYFTTFCYTCCFCSIPGSLTSKGSTSRQRITEQESSISHRPGPGQIQQPLMDRD